MSSKLTPRLLLFLHLLQQPKSTPLHLEPSQFKNDTNSPIVEVLTTSLIEGGNVFRVKITDKAPITTAQITFVQNGQLVTQGLVRDPNNIYKALIDAHLPSAVVVTSAVDVHGKTASVVKYLNVTPLSKQHSCTDNKLFRWYWKEYSFHIWIRKIIISTLT